MSNDRTTATKVPSVQRVKVSDQNLQRFINSVTEVLEVREGNRGQSLDKNITWRDLVDNDIVVSRLGGYEPAPDPVDPDDIIPPKITGFEATGGFEMIFLTWDRVFRPYSHTEIYRWTSDDISSAVRIGTAAYPDCMYIDYLPESINETFYYWARFISSAGVIGDWNATAGTPATTASDPSYFLELLTEDIANGTLWKTLSNKIITQDLSGYYEELYWEDGIKGAIDQLVLNDGENTAAIEQAMLILSGDGTNVSIVAFSHENPCKVTTWTDHDYSTGDVVKFSASGGQTELQGENCVITVVDARSFTLDGIDSTGWSSYTAGATCHRVGLEAMYYVKTDINGYVAGFGLYNDGSFSEFLVNADRFAIGKSGVDDYPFIVVTTPTVINGVTVPAGVYMNSAFIHEAQIETAMIKNLAVTSAKIASLDVAKLTGGYISASLIDAGSIFIPESNITNLTEAYFRAVAVGYWEDDFWNYRGIFKKDGTRVKNGASDWYPARSWNIAFYHRTNKTWDCFYTADVYDPTNGPANSADFAWYLTYSGYANSNYIAVILTADEPYQNFSSAMKDALMDWGASRNALESIGERSSYTLIGMKGIGEGKGIESVFPGGVDSYCDQPFTVTNSTLNVPGSYAKFDPFNMQAPASGLSGLYLQPEQMGYYNATYGNWPAVIYNDGQFYFGNPGQTKYVYWNGSALTIRGTLYGDDIVASSITTDKLYYSGLSGAVSYMATSTPANALVSQTSWTSIGSVTVTPSSVGSKFIIIVSCYGEGSGYATFFNLAITNGTSVIASSSSYLNANCSTVTVDAPATTSSVTYYAVAYGAYVSGDTWYDVYAKGIKIGVLEVKR